MVTALLNEINNQPTAYHTFFLSGAGARTVFFPVDPRFKTSIQVKKNGQTATVDVTTATKKTTAAAAEDDLDPPDGGRLADLETAPFSQVSSGTGDYIANNDTHISCVKVVSTPTSGNVVIIINQFKTP